MSEVDRRRFLERMSALGAAAVFAPGTLGSRTTRFAEPTRAAGARATRRGFATARATAPAGQTPRPIDLRELFPDVGEVGDRAEDPTELTLLEAAALLEEGELTALELVEACLDRIGRWDERYRAFNAVLVEAAREAARRADRAARRVPLAGIPLAIKDNFFTAGVPTTANSLLFEGFVPDFDATAWARLRDAGAILLGKTQMGPLATTAATTPAGERTTVNAWVPFDDRVSPGGSSSGSATAVAGRLASCATGTQTGGSITSPSGAQGLTGIKPTMGRVSLHGILPLSYTRDHVGPLARDARDAALMLQVMAGPDPADPRTLGLPPVPDYLRAVAPVDREGRPALAGPTRVGVWPGYLDEPDPPSEPPEGPEREEEDQGGRREAQTADPERARAARRARYERARAEVPARAAWLAALEGLGAEIVELDEPPAWSTLTSSAFNNVRLPERSEIFLGHLREDVRGFGVSLSPWINGLLLPAAEYVRGQRARLLLLRAILDDVFSRCELVVQTAPFPFDMVGLPLIAFPIGFESASAGVPRPLSAMLGAPPYEEDRLLACVAAYQRVSDWHRRRPADPDELDRAAPDGPDGGRGPSRLDLFEVMERGE